MSGSPVSISGAAYVGGGSPQFIGGSATSEIGFYGASATTQPATVTSVTTTAATSTTPYGYLTSTQADAVVTSLNSVIAKLKTLGLIAT